MRILIVDDDPGLRKSLGIEPTLVADQAVTVDHAINDFMTSLWQAIVIILACSFVSLGVRPGTVVALAIPLTMAVVFAVMQIGGIIEHLAKVDVIAGGMDGEDALFLHDSLGFLA